MSGLHTTLGPSVSGPALSTPLTWSVDFHATPIGPVIHGWGRGRLVARSTIARRQQARRTDIIIIVIIIFCSNCVTLYTGDSTVSQTGSCEH